MGTHLRDWLRIKKYDVNRPIKTFFSDIVS